MYSILYFMLSKYIKKNSSPHLKLKYNTTHFRYARFFSLYTPLRNLEIPKNPNVKFALHFVLEVSIT